MVIGDSISIGYTLPLRSALKGKYNVLRPIEANGTPINCGGSSDILKNLDSWLEEANPDVVVFNTGLWDIASRVEEDPKQTRLTIQDYTSNLNEIISRLKASGARLIWASTTRVPDGASFRDNSNAVRFNKAATEVMEKNNIETIDLYSSSSQIPTSMRLGRRNVHFAGDGSKILADKITQSVTR